MKGPSPELGGRSLRLSLNRPEPLQRPAASRGGTEKSGHLFESKTSYARADPPRRTAPAEALLR
jgi:hypothetical protein